MLELHTFKGPPYPFEGGDNSNGFALSGDVYAGMSFAHLNPWDTITAQLRTLRHDIDDDVEDSEQPVDQSDDAIDTLVLSDDRNGGDESVDVDEERVPLDTSDDEEPTLQEQLEIEFLEVELT